jgi:hypothetical protein
MRKTEIYYSVGSSRGNNLAWVTYWNSATLSPEEFILGFSDICTSGEYFVSLIWQFNYRDQRMLLQMIKFVRIHVKL